VSWVITLLWVTCAIHALAHIRTGVEGGAGHRYREEVVRVGGRVGVRVRGGGGVAH
jgi:hypothetical protein